MYSKVKIAGHPVHPMLVSFPVALYVVTLVALIAYQASGNGFWFDVGIAANGAGVAMAALAAVPGAIDFVMGIPSKTRAAATARTHALLNVGALAVFLVNFALIAEGWSGPIENAGVAVLLSALGVLLTIGAGAYGWKLVQTHHVGVEPLPEESTRREPVEHRP